MHILHGELFFSTCPSKKACFCGHFKLPNFVCREVRATPTIVEPLAKTLDSERIFGLKG